RRVATPRGGGPLNQRSSIYMLMRLTSRPGFDATTKKLCVINVVSQHDVTANQQLSADCNQRFGFASFGSKSQIESFQLLVISGSCLSSFAEQKPNQSRTGFADPDVALLLSRRTFHRFHTNISYHLALIAESGDRLQGVYQAERSQQPQTWMCPEQLSFRIILCLLLQPFDNLGDASVKIVQQR